MAILTKGLPQGSVLSPLLFNLYTHDLDLAIDKNVDVLQYADDLLLYIKGNNIDDASAKLTESLILEYGTFLLEPGSMSGFKALDKIQSKCLRIICGAMKTSPINALQAECYASKHFANSNVGVGVFHFQYNIVQKIKLPPECTVFSGECLGIFKALEYIRLAKLKKSIVFTDSLSSIQALVKNPFKIKQQHPCIFGIRQLLTECTEKDIDTSKEKVIKELNFLSEKDATPFYKLPLKSLLQIYKTTKNDVEKGFCKNRLYYISQRIECPPSTLSEQIVKRLFIYKLSFEWLESSLNVLLAMNVSGDRIKRDLWVLKYHHKTIQERLERVKSVGVENLYPWMVRCSEDILNRSIQISQETKTILGENKSTKMYLAQRLNTSPKVIEDMYVKIPALKTIRVTKAKNFLDFLIKEGFTVEEIVDKPRIFAASQKTVKLRLEKLRSLGLCEINLNILCRSRKDFQKYYESMESISKECDE
ncbi:transcription termination factor, mitochondrial [Melitaea cinxia]|uniref:transcription termination factor, mitochondrial n=1 Tax=Melitaea cinxia TaxID=113334 RepID=UPI001E2747BE|nr:transcription termination factor, mitochondrial [Melitaea cinxia]